MQIVLFKFLQFSLNNLSSEKDYYSSFMLISLKFWKSLKKWLEIRNKQNNILLKPCILWKFFSNLFFWSSSFFKKKTNLWLWIIWGEKKKVLIFVKIKEPHYLLCDWWFAAYGPKKRMENMGKQRRLHWRFWGK